MQVPIGPQASGPKKQVSGFNPTTKLPVDAWVQENIVQYLNQSSQKSFLEKILPYLQSLKQAQMKKAPLLTNLLQLGTAQNIRTAVMESAKSQLLLPQLSGLEELMTILQQINPQLKNELRPFMNQLQQMRGSIPDLSEEQFEQLDQMWTTVTRLIPQNTSNRYWPVMKETFAQMGGTTQGEKESCAAAVQAAQAQTETAESMNDLLDQLQNLLALMQSGKELTPQQLGQILSILKALQEKSQQLSPGEVELIQTLLHSFTPGKKKKKLSEADIAAAMGLMGSGSGAPIMQAVQNAKSSLQDLIAGLGEVGEGSDEAQGDLDALHEQLVNAPVPEFLVKAGEAGRPGMVGAMGGAEEAADAKLTGGPTPGDTPGGNTPSPGGDTPPPFNPSGPGYDPNADIQNNVQNVLFKEIEPFFMEQFLFYGNILYGDEIGSQITTDVMNAISQTAASSFADAATHFAFSNMLGKPNPNDGSYSGNAASMNTYLDNERASITQDLAAIAKLLGSGKGSLDAYIKQVQDDPHMLPADKAALIKKLQDYKTNLAGAQTMLTNLQNDLANVKAIPAPNANSTDSFALQGGNSGNANWATQLGKDEGNVINGPTDDPNANPNYGTHPEWGLTAINTEISGDSSEYTNMATPDQMNVQYYSMQYNQYWTSLGTVLTTLNQILQSLGGGIFPR